MKKKQTKWSRKEVLLLILASVLWFPVIFVVMLAKIPTQRKKHIAVISTLVAMVIGYTGLSILTMVYSQEPASTSTQITPTKDINTKKILSLLDKDLGTKFINNKDLNDSALKFVKAAIKSKNGSINHSSIMKRSEYAYGNYTYYVEATASEQAYLNGILKYASKHSDWRPYAYQNVGIATLKQSSQVSNLVVVIFANPPGSLPVNTLPGYTQQPTQIRNGRGSQDQQYTSPDSPPADFGGYNGYDPYVGDYGSQESNNSYEYTPPETNVSQPDNCHAGYYLCN